MAGNGTELNIAAGRAVQNDDVPRVEFVVVAVQNGVVPQVNVIADYDVQNAIVPKVDTPPALGIQNVVVPQVDFAANVVQYDIVPQVDIASVQNDAVPQVDAPAGGGIQNGDVPKVNVIVVGDQNGIVLQVDQNDTVQQAAAATEVEPAEPSDKYEMYEFEGERCGKKMKYLRHPRGQYRDLENFFMQYPRPTEKQRKELSMKLGMDMKQIKFWFQNRRTQMKNELERHENVLLRNQNNEVIAKNTILRRNMVEPKCTSRGILVVLEPLTLENEQLRAKNTRLKEEVDRLCALSNRYNSRPPISPSAIALAPPTPTLAQNNNHNRNPVGPCFIQNNIHNHNNNNAYNRNPAGLGISAPTKTLRPVVLSSSGHNWEVYKQYVYKATTEVMSMTHMGEPLWVKKSDGEEVLNLKYYPRVSAHGLVEWKDHEFVTEATRTSGIVCINGLALIKAEFQPISPLISVRTSKFIRFCKLRLPSGCIIYDLNNGCSKVTWVEHVQYDERLVHPMMRPMVRSGMGFGAKRWIATLQRYCECITLLLASSNMPQDPSMLSVAEKKSLMKLSQKMVNSFYHVISIDSSNCVWEDLSPTTMGENVRIIMLRKNSTDPKEAAGIILSASTSLQIPVSRRRVFEFLTREDTRKDWDFLFSGVSLKEIVRIPKALSRGNSVSILRVAQTGGSYDNGVSFILQETWDDATSSSLVYAAVDAPILKLAMSGGDCSFVSLLPSGFTIFPDGKGGGGGEGGCIMTTTFQILVSIDPESGMDIGLVRTLDNLLTCTTQCIKDAFQIP
ncbi:Homeobox-leucine zipper protein HDG1 [Linum perenne]